MTSTIANRRPKPDPSAAFTEVLAARQCNAVEREAMMRQLDYLMAEQRVADDRLRRALAFEHEQFGFYAGQDRDFFTSASHAAEVTLRELTRGIVAARSILDMAPNSCNCRECIRVSSVSLSHRVDASTRRRIISYVASIFLSLHPSLIVLCCSFSIPLLANRSRLFFP